MKNKYGLSQAEIDFSDKIAKQIVDTVQAKGLDFNKVLQKMREGNAKLEAKINAIKKDKVA